MLASKSAVLLRRRFFSPGVGLLAACPPFPAFPAGLVSLAGFAVFATGGSLGADFVSLEAGLALRPAATIGWAGAPAAASRSASVEARLPVRLRLIVRS